MKDISTWWKKKDLPERLLWIGFTFILGLPWLLTRPWGLFAFNAKTGVIGDTIGGITGPVSGFLGAYLVWMALKEQIKANKIITDQFSEQKKDEQGAKISMIITEQIKFLREEIKDFEHTREGTDNLNTLNGPKAIRRFLIDVPNEHVSPKEDIYYVTNFQELLLLLLNFSHVVKLSYDENLNIIDKEHFQNILSQLLLHSFKFGIDQNKNKVESKQPKCPTCQRKHGIPDSLIGLYEELERLLPPVWNTKTSTT